MRDSSQNGSSFIHTIQIIALAISIGCVVLFLCSKYWHYKKIAEITGDMGAFFEKYQEGSKDLITQKANLDNPIPLKNYGILEKCDEVQSMFSSQKSVCELPLGELDVKTEFKKPYLYTYTYVHFNDIYKRLSCEQFLNVGWQKVLPAYYWGEHGYIGVLSENTSGQMFFSNDADDIAQKGAQKDPTPEHAKEVCDYCKNSRYCTVLFLFEMVDKSDKTVFPAEFAGENPDGGEQEEVSKDGNTYTKTKGDVKEVVTYQDGGIFSGATFSGGAISRVYEGTWTSQGITSYKSYTDPSKTNLAKKVDNITYDKKGNVTSYEKDSQKFLLIGDSADCLILDNSTNTKKLGDCSKPFQDEVSFVVLNYDEKGLLSEISSEGGENSLYKFLYDPLDSKLIGYCDKVSGECRNVVDGKTVQDILKHDVPDTIGKFNKMYKDVKEDTSVKPARKKHRILTKEEALKYVKDKDNQVRVKFK
ncbi:MAG: hypothetical protein IJ870_02235 [Alphaproteobacteria bacterium]|nr:hypothetical protein [Alphaproteobacteria bacterium]